MDEPISNERYDQLIQEATKAEAARMADESDKYSPFGRNDMRTTQITEEDEALLVREAKEGYDVDKLRPRMNGPCPYCSERGGFHRDDIHTVWIAPKYLKEKGWHLVKTIS